MVFLCKKTLVDLLSIRHFSEEVAFQTVEKPWDVLVFPWFPQIFTKFTEVSNHCNAPAAAALLVLLRPDYAPESQAAPPAAHWTGCVTGRSSKKT